jgi:hypothetical protein
LPFIVGARLQLPTRSPKPSFIDDVYNAERFHPTLAIGPAGEK